MARKGIALVFAVAATLGWSAAVSSFAAPGASSRQTGEILFTREMNVPRPARTADDCDGADPSACAPDDEAYYSLETVRSNGTRIRQLPTCRRVCDDAYGSWSPRGKRIAFVRGGRLVISRSDGSHARRIRTRLPVEGKPAWAPDGKRIAVTGELGLGLTAIYVVRIDGSAARRISEGNMDAQPAWSSRGQIAFSRDLSVDGGADPDVYLTNPLGTNATRLTFRGGQAPSFSPSGRKLAYSRTNGVTFSMGVDGTARRRLGLGYESTWSPDGRSVAVTRESGIYVMSALGGKQRRIVATRFSDLRGAESALAPDWRPARTR